MLLARTADVIRPFLRAILASSTLAYAVAPAVFLALGLCDELVFHRRRTTHREDLIHTTQHLAEGIMWTALYASRVFQARARPRVFAR